VSVGHEDHRGIPVAVAVARGGLHQPLDLSLGQVFAGPQVAVPAPSWGNCSFLAVGVTSLRSDLAIGFGLPARTSIRIMAFLPTVEKPTMAQMPKAACDSDKGFTGSME
jgi:hypothetical protein